MKKVLVKMKKLKVNKFSPKERTVEIDVVFNDGANKEITKKVAIDDPQRLAEDILLEIRNLEKSSNQRFDGESILDDMVTIVFEDEDKTLQRMTMFFSRVCDKIQEVRNSRDPSGYLNLINRVNSLVFDFT